MRMLLWIGYALGGVVALAALVVLTGYLLPADHVATDVAAIEASPSRVAALVRSVERQPDWRTAMTAVEVRSRDGATVEYTEVSGEDRIRLRLHEVERDRRFESVITDETLPFGGRWTIVVVPQGETTRVTIEEHGTVRNPVYRFVSALIIGHHATVRRYLADLQKAARR